MTRLPCAVAALWIAILSCDRRSFNERRAYALVSVDGNRLPVSVYVAEAGHNPAAPPNPLPCDTWVTDGVIVVEGDSAWDIRARRVDTCVTPADTTLEERHGPLRLVNDSVQLKLDRTGFVLERGTWRGDTIVIMRREWHGDAGGGPPLRWSFAVTTRQRPNDR